MSISDWVDCTAAPDADRRIVDLITITLPKKFGVRFLSLIYYPSLIDSKNSVRLCGCP